MLSAIPPIPMFILSKPKECPARATTPTMILPKLFDILTSSRQLARNRLLATLQGLLYGRIQIALNLDTVEIVVVTDPKGVLISLSPVLLLPVLLIQQSISDIVPKEVVLEIIYIRGPPL